MTKTVKPYIFKSIEGLLTLLIRMGTGAMESDPLDFTYVGECAICEEPLDARDAVECEQCGRVVCKVHIEKELCEDCRNNPFQKEIKYSEIPFRKWALGKRY